MDTEKLVKRLHEHALRSAGDVGFVPLTGREACETANLIERLVATVCLADDVLMDAIGAFPLPGNPHRADCLIIRSISGDDYAERKRFAALARRP